MTNPIFEQAKAALAAGHKLESQGFLAQLLQHEPDNEAAWLCMSEAVDEPDRKRYCLQRALAIDPASVEGRRLLAELEHPPEAAPVSAPEAPAAPVSEAAPVSAPAAPAVVASPPAPVAAASEVAPVSAPEAPAVPVSPPAPAAPVSEAVSVSAPETPAQAEAEPASDTERSVAVLLETAVWLVEQKRTGEGVALLEKAVARDPDNETAWLWLAAAAEDVDQKRRYLARVLEINPKSKMGHKLLAQLDAPPRRRTGILKPKGKG